jgi:hypothetical protein
MKLIFIYGMPASGKMTVAQELVAITGYKLFHNHLVVDMLQTVFEFGSPEFVALREEFWLAVFRSGLPRQVAWHDLYIRSRVNGAAGVHRQRDQDRGVAGSEVDFIQLTCPLPELKRRMGGLSRLQYKKLTSVPLFEQLHEEGAFEAEYMPKPKLSIDTSDNQPARAALQIARALDLLPVK